MSIKERLRALALRDQQIRRHQRRRTNKGKGRTPAYASLKKRLDQVFSVWVRRRWADELGRVSCVCCGAVKRWQEQQCAHYVSRHYLGTRWAPANCAPCCAGCNVFKKGNYPAYTLWLEKYYGPGIVSRLLYLSREPVKYSRADLQALIEEYQGRISVLDGDGSELF